MRVKAVRDLVSFVLKKGSSVEKSVSENAINESARKGTRKRKIHKSAQRPMAVIPFVQTNALKRKKIPKEKRVGAVSK